MKTRELSMGEKQIILKPREMGKLTRVIAQTQGHGQGNVLQCPEKETSDVCQPQTLNRLPRESTTVDDRNLVRAVMQHPKTTVCDITANLMMFYWY